MGKEVDKTKGEIKQAIGDLRRAHSIGHHRQTLNLLTCALGINALALHLHRQRHDPPLAA